MIHATFRLISQAIIGKTFCSRCNSKKVSPEYPKEALKSKIQGHVIVKALVNEKGRVVKVCGVEGEKILQEATIRAVEQWEFKPGYGLIFSPSEVESKKERFIEVYILVNFKISNLESEK
ncbi:MAG: energy transducer TonB [Acidobacteria bacterium]|nr:MAG: energy transducer TonB [Acidobacteriota bacterium]